MGALVDLTEMMFPIDTDRLRAGLDKLQAIRDGVPCLVTPYEARAVLAAITRYEAMATEAREALRGVNESGAPT
jgi:hypothetical protein